MMMNRKEELLPLAPLAPPARSPAPSPAHSLAHSLTRSPACPLARSLSFWMDQKVVSTLFPNFHFFCVWHFFWKIYTGQPNRPKQFFFRAKCVEMSKLPWVWVSFWGSLWSQRAPTFPKNLLSSACLKKSILLLIFFVIIAIGDVISRSLKICYCQATVHRRENGSDVSLTVRHSDSNIVRV